MKSLHHFIIIAAALLLLSACEKTPEDPQVGINPPVNVLIDGVHYSLSGMNATVLPLPDNAKYQSDVMLPDTLFYHDTVFIVREIAEKAFYKADQLTAVRIPKHVTKIPDGAFQECTALTTVSFAPNASLRSIGNFAFVKTSALTAVELPAKVSQIGSSVFYFSGIQSAIINSPVSYLQDHLFDGCTNLETVTIGNQVKMIGNFAFTDCSRLWKIYCYALQPPSVSNNTFLNCKIGDIDLYVPASAINTYKSVSPWMSFGHIVPIE